MSVRYRTCVLAVAGLLTGAGFSNAASFDDLAEREGFYVGGTGGYTFPDDIDVNQGPIESELDLDEGWSVTGAVGAYVGAFRIEGEGSYRENDFDQGSPILDIGDGTLSAWSAMANVYLDIPISEVFELYVGGGAGWAWVDTEADTSLGDIDEQDDGFAWQVMAGATFNVNERTHVLVGYRLWSTEDLEFDSTDADQPLIHTAEVGLRLDL